MGHHNKKDENVIFTKMKTPVEFMPKPRTALFQGEENDEHIAPQIIQLGSFKFDANKTIIMKEGVLANTATMETKLIFQGNNLHNKIEEKKEPGKEATVISYSDGLHHACRSRERLISISM